MAALRDTLARAASELARRPLVWNDHEVALTFSFGIALRRLDDGFESCIERADRARSGSLAV